MKDSIPSARDIMTSKVVTLRPEMPVHDAAEILLKHGILSAPVVGEDGRFVGVFSQQGCMTALIAAAHDQVPTTFQVKAFLEAGAPTVTEETELISATWEQGTLLVATTTCRIGCNAERERSNRVAGV